MTAGPEDPLDAGPGRHERLLRTVGSLAGIVLIAGLGFLYGVLSTSNQNGAYRLARQGIAGFHELLAGKEGRIAEFLQPARHAGDGVTVNRIGDDGTLILLSGFFDGGNEIRLVRRDGSVVNRWRPSFTRLFPDTSHLVHPPLSDLNVDTHGALIEPDGAVVFNFEYAGSAKLDRCGGIIWRLPGHTHHSVERAVGGGYWIPGRDIWRNSEHDRFPPFSGDGAPTFFGEDLVLRVSPDGRIERRISVPQLLYDSGLRPLLTATGIATNRGPMYREGELLHLNDIEELTPEMAAAFPWPAGSLLLSMRDYNLVAVIDPQEARLLWHQTGPWERQHDPDFAPDGTITVFSNSIFVDRPITAAELAAHPEGISKILRLDPATGALSVAWGEGLAQAMASPIRGKHQATPDGGFLITEFAAGRVIETDAAGSIVWEYVNRHDADRVGEISEARLVPESGLAVPDWTCPES